MPSPEQPTVAERIAALPPAKLFRFEDLARRKVEQLEAKEEVYHAWADKIEDDISSTPEGFKFTGAGNTTSFLMEVNRLSEHSETSPADGSRYFPRINHVASLGLIPDDVYQRLAEEPSIVPNKDTVEDHLKDKYWYLGTKKYTYEETIYHLRSASNGVYLVKSEEDGQFAVVKGKVDSIEAVNLLYANKYLEENPDLLVNGQAVFPKMLNSWQEGNRNFIALEVAQGISLSKILSLDYTIPFADSLTIADSLLSCFQMIHENFQTTYRDWKPYETIWDPKKRVAVVVDWDGVTPRSVSMEFSNILGAMQEAEWVKVAAILYTLVTGRQYSFDKNYHEQISADLIPQRDIRALLSKALNPDYEKRYHSAKGFRTDVKMVLERVKKTAPAPATKVEDVKGGN